MKRRIQWQSASSGAFAAGELCRRIGEVLDFGSAHGFDKRVAGLKVAVERANSNSGLFSEIIQIDLGAGACKCILCDLQQPLAVSLRIGAQSSPFRLVW